MESRVETKTSWAAKAASQPYLSARMEVVLPAGMAVISRQMDFSSPSMGRGSISPQTSRGKASSRRAL